MPKMKTKQAAAKRFSMTASGKLKRGVAGKRHRLISHNSKYIRTNRGTVVVAEADTPRVKKQFLHRHSKRSFFKQTLQLALRDRHLRALGIFCSQ